MRYRSSQAASLTGWQLAFNKRAHDKPGVAYANIVPATARVEGVLYRLFGHAEIARMDPYEGYPERYRRECLQVETPAGPQWSWVYVANAHWQAEKLLPERAYLNHLLSGRPWLSDGYYRALLATPCFSG